MTEAERSTSVARLDQGLVEYRLEQRKGPAVLVLHGGHMRAGLALGEEVFAESGYTVLAPSRPGYGHTPLSTGTSVSGFTDVIRALCEHLGITEIVAVVGISGGGPSAVTMSARHPDLVQRLILQSAVGWLAWPDRLTRVGAHAVFAPATEHATWAAIRGLMRLAPETCLGLLLGGLSTVPVRDVVAALRPEDRSTLVSLFSRMRSGSGFLNDLRPVPDVTSAVRQPTLVVATRKDGAVPFAHAQSLTAAIARAELVESQADSHFIWCGHDWSTVAERIRAFLSAGPFMPLP
ncbi:alpha/beta fold hydrolase [Streptomyces sp. NPDC058864]